MLGKSLAQSLIKHDDMLLIQSKSQKQRHLLYYHQSHGLHYSIMTVKSDPRDVPSFHFLAFSSVPRRSSLRCPSAGTRPTCWTRSRKLLPLSSYLENRRRHCPPPPMVKHSFWLGEMGCYLLSRFFPVCCVEVK